MLIRKYRLERGWSQEQLAQMAGISTRTLQRVERGKSASAETLKCLAAVLEVDHLDLSTEAQMDQGLITQDELRAMAYVDDLRDFYGHAISYVIVIGALAMFNILYASDTIWVIWPALCWGIGLAVHAAATFEILPFWGPEWEKRQVEKRLEQLRR